MPDMVSEKSRYEAHLFICTNHRDNGQCCAAKGSLELRERLKKFCKDPARGWKGRVRVNASGCLGRCAEGINAVLYPEGRWFSCVKVESAAELEKELSAVLDKEND